MLCETVFSSPEAEHSPTGIAAGRKSVDSPYAAVSNENVSQSILKQYPPEPFILDRYLHGGVSPVEAIEQNQLARLNLLTRNRPGGLWFDTVPLRHLRNLTSSVICLDQKCS